MPFQDSMINEIIEQCRLQNSETPWIEFKANGSNPQDIGEYISALSNSAALFNKNPYLHSGVICSSKLRICAIKIPVS